MRTFRLATAAVVLATGGLVSTLSDTGSPAFAQSGNACLQNNRIWSTSVVDDRTIIATDRAGNPFVVELSGGCTGLTRNFGRIDFRTRGNLGCLSRGDRLSFRDRTLGRNTCFVRDVHTDLTTLAGAGRSAVRTARVTR
jgi:hypothetical protein